MKLALLLLAVFAAHAQVVSYRQDWALFSLREAAWKTFLRPAGREDEAAPKAEELKKIERFVWARHKVKATDNVWKLAMNYGTSVESLQSSNGGELIWMKPGTDILVLNRRGTLHQVKLKKDETPETLQDIAGFYKKDEAGREKLMAEMVKANDLPAYALMGNFELIPGTYLLVPGTYLDFDTFRIPFKSLTRISSGFGLRYHPILKRKKFHDGTDFAQPYNTPVYASRSGRVIFAGWREGYGLMVIIKHTDGATSRYGHMSRIHVKEGQWVDGGKKMIGRVGSTGLSTGPHLHFEIRDSLGRPLNPRRKIGRK